MSFYTRNRVVTMLVLIGLLEIGVYMIVRELNSQAEQAQEESENPRP